MDRTIYIDIETIPAGNKIDPATMPHPATMKVEKTIEAWRKDKAPQAAEEQYRKRALKSMEGEIFCIGWAVGDDEVSVIRDLYEHGLLIAWMDKLEEKIDLRESITWVGHNNLTFDMAWLWRRAIKYDMKMLANMINLDRYKGNIRDTMIMWRGSDFQDYTSLDALAKWLGIGEQVGSGADVYDQYLAGEYQKIANHCKEDVELVRKVYKKIKGMEKCICVDFLNCNPDPVPNPDCPIHGSMRR